MDVGQTWALTSSDNSQELCKSPCVQGHSQWYTQRWVRIAVMHDANSRSGSGKTWDAAAGNHRRQRQRTTRARWFRGIDAYAKGSLPDWQLLALYFCCVRNICAHQGAATDIIRLADACQLAPRHELAGRLTDALQVLLDERMSSAATDGVSRFPGTKAAAAASVPSSFGPDPLWTAIARQRLPRHRLRSLSKAFASICVPCSTDAPRPTPRGVPCQVVRTHCGLLSVQFMHGICDAAPRMSCPKESCS